MRRSALILALLSLPAVAGALPAGEKIAVQLDVPDAVGGSDWPLAVNVPFSPGEMKGQPLSLRRGATVLPTQATPLAHWPDGSLRWVQLNAVLPARAARGAQFEVTDAASPAPLSPLVVEESGQGVSVDTGAVAFEVPRARFAIAENVRLHRGSKPAIAAVGSSMIADGRVQQPSPPKTLRIARRGPVHAEIEMRGEWGGEFEYIVRLAVDAGSPFVRVLHTYVKTGGRSESIVERMSIDVPFAAPLVGDYAVGIDRGKPLRGEMEEQDTHHFAQVDNERMEADGEGRAGQLAGWFELAAKRGAVGLASRWFWQEYPQAVSLGAAGMTYDLWSPRGGTARIGIGSSKTHEVVLWLTARGVIGRARAGAVATPLRGFVSPARLARSGALGDAIDPTETRFDEEALEASRRYLIRNSRESWDDCGEVRCTGAQSVVRKGAYGMLNWGDWNFPGLRDTVKGTDAWGNLEYDTAQVLALIHAATADPTAFDAMVAAARHHMDVDVIHALPGRAEWVGMNHPKNPRHFSFELGGVDLGHTWTEGLVSYYLLTGDERGLAAARGIADYLVRRVGDFMRGNPRQWGWPQIALVAVYDVTGEQRYLDAARAYAARGMQAHPPRAENPAWKLGILADALAHTHARGGGAEIEKWLGEYAAGIVKARPRDSRFYPGVAYMGRMNGNAQWTELARDKVGGLNLGNWGKPLTIQGRVGFRILSLLQSTPPQPARPQAAALDGFTTSRPQ